MTNAIKFIKEHGVEKARKVVEGAPEGVSLLEYIPICSGLSYIKIIDGIRYCFNPGANNWFVDNFKAEISFQFKDFKRLVESVELVEHFSNDLVGAKQLLEFSKDCKTIELSGSVITIERLEQAIADYEAIYSIP